VTTKLEEPQSSPPHGKPSPRTLPKELGEPRYDPLSNRYVFKKKIGDEGVIVTLTMTPEEYMAYRTWRFQTRYFRSRNAIGQVDSLTPRRLSSLSPLRDKRKPEQPTGTVFGAGGVRLTTQGTFEVSMGVKHDRTDNPTLPQRARRRTTFDMGQDIRVNLNAKVGEKIDFDINYDSQEAFDVEAKR
jgi:cell surface protein SprA